MLRFPLTLSTLFLALAALPAHAQEPAGGLTVAPTRVVFDDRTRSAALNLINTGTRPATYRITVVEMRMTEDGELVEVKPGASDNSPSAEPLVRFSPRQVRLEPGVSQAVRLMLRKPAGLPRGEYRSHFLFRAVPEAEPARAEASAPAQGFSINLQAVYGVTIPVIVRQGELSARTTMTDLRLERSASGAADQFALTLRREGDRSLYGDLEVSFAPAGGAFRPVAAFRGVGVYTPNAARKVRFPLPKDRVAGGGRLRVRYVEPGGALLAEAEAAAP